MIYEASLRGIMGAMLVAEFAECEISMDDGSTILWFSPEALGQVLTRIQDFGLDLVNLRLRSDPIAD